MTKTTRVYKNGGVATDSTTTVGPSATIADPKDADTTKKEDENANPGDSVKEDSSTTDPIPDSKDADEKKPAEVKTEIPVPSNKKYKIEEEEPYLSIGIKNLCKQGQVILQGQLNSLNLDDVLYPAFCSQINHPAFAKPILNIYGETFIEIFKKELFNCIQFNLGEKNNIICKKIDEIYNKLRVSFQNIVIKNETESNLKLFDKELAFFGGKDVSVSSAKATVSTFIDNTIPMEYIKYVKAILKDNVVHLFETYFHNKKHFNIHDKYNEYFDFKKDDNVEGSLKKTKVTSIVNHFLSASVKKPRTILGGEDKGEKEETKEEDEEKEEEKEGDEEKEGEETKEGDEEKEETKEGEGEDTASPEDVADIVYDVIIKKTNIDTLIMNTLNCGKIQDYIVNGFEKLLYDNVFKNTEEMENIISYAFSELMLYIYENGVYPENMEYELSYKFRIIQNFVNNYPMDRLQTLLKTVCINDYSLLLKVRERLKNSDVILKQVFKYWNSNFTKLVQFFQAKKREETKNKKESGKEESDKTAKDVEKESNTTNTLKRTFFLKFLNFIKPIVMISNPNGPKTIGGGNIKMKSQTKSRKQRIKQKAGEETEQNVTKRRKPCPKGTRWVEQAQKCMTADEKKEFMLERKKNLKNLAHNSNLGKIIESRFEPFADEESKAESEVKEEVGEKVESEKTGETGETEESNVEETEESEKTEESKVEEVEESKESEKTVSNVSLQSNKSLPSTFPLEPQQKKCPNGYTQHPKKSRKCVNNNDLHKPKSSLTRKNKSKIPEIQTETEIQNAVEEDVLEEQHPVEEPVEEPIEKKTDKKKVVPLPELDPEKQEYDDYLANPDTTNSHLYPHLLDPNFNEKIALKKEFSDFRYDGDIHDVQTQSQIECKAPFELLPNQQFVKNFLSVQTPYNSLLLYLGLGSGKCHAKGTPLLMFDGTVQLVENINVGDLLMGDDSKPRTVLSLANGRDKMYDIIPIKGDKYTVNEEHILCLRASGYPIIYHINTDKKNEFKLEWIENNEFKTKSFSCNLKKNNELEIKNKAMQFYEKIQDTADNIVEISVKDYLQLSNRKRSVLKGYKTAVDFPEQELPFDPYMIGYWLGDGTSRDSAFTCQDSTVLHYFVHNLPKNKLALFHRSKYSYGISGTGKLHGNVFLNTLKNMKLINNKHIPAIYKCNSRENRLKLLAGLLDSDGHLDIHGNGFEFTQKNEKLMDDVVYLARSLGFSCYKSEKKTSWTYKGIYNTGTAFRINISGIGIEEIPTKIPRKKAISRKQIKDVLVTGIKVKYVREDEYYGFTLDGNGRYLMSDFTVTHNTCAAIGVTEEMRLYMKQVGVVKKILVVASPNVQVNFRLQLFDESRLQEIGKKGSGVWNLDTCVGYDLLKEIQTTNMTREYVVRKINTIINEYYDFIGYESLAIYIEEMAGLRRTEDANTNIDEKKIRQVFDDRLIVIDEVHNIIGKEDDENKHTSNMIMKLVKYCENLRLLFLSATPMYNSYKEIIWLLNIMNLNDHRSMIRVEQVFQENGEFVEEVKDEKGVVIVESGKELLKRKSIGYVSYVRGENPYTFPYRIYPSLFAEDAFQMQKKTYPTLQMNGTEIAKPLQHLDVFITAMDEYQKNGYDLLVQYAKDFIPHFEEKESFGHTVLQGPISALNMIYPNEDFDEYLLHTKPASASVSSGFMGITSIFGGEGEEKSESSLEESSEEESPKEESPTSSEEESPKSSEAESSPEESPKSSEEASSPEASPIVPVPVPVPIPQKKTYSKEEIKDLIHNIHGKNGLNNIISFSKPDANTPLFHDFEYKPEILQKYGRIFKQENIGKYSAKIAKICDILSKSTGIVLIYSKFIEGGLIPMALALEEMGFQRYGEANYTKSLFKQKPVDFILNPITMKPNGPTETFSAKYVMITGQKYYSPNNSADLRLVTDLSNKRGEQVRVVLISEAGSEGLDFKNIRQVHILDPWYNINRIEQVIGRAVRNKSHCSLPIAERNVEIYMHGTFIDSQTETADLYMYRLAEKKALQIGTVTRVLKETAVDCLLNINQSNFTQAKMAQNLNLVLSTNQKSIDFAVGDKPFSNMCDYMETCDFTCNGKKPPSESEIEISPTYDQYFLQNTHPRISKRIRQLFREKTIYSLDSLVKEINIIKPFPIEQVYYSISVFLKNHEEWLVDKKGRKGYMIQREDIYAFQPLEISNEKASIFERSTPLEYKRKTIPIEMPKDPILTTEPKPKPKPKSTKGENSVGLDSEYQVLYSQLQKDLETVLSSSSYVKPLKQNMNWYKYAKLSLRICIDKHKIERKTVVRYIVYHHMDCLELKDRIIFLNNLLSTFESFVEESGDSESNSIAISIETILRKYFMDKIDQTNPDKKYVLLNSKNNNVVYSLTKESRLWKEEPAYPDSSNWMQTFNLRKSLLDKVNAEVVNNSECNVGFVGVFKENYGFKIKNLLNTRPKPGALCDQSDKQKLIAKINDMLEKMGKTGEMYNKDPIYGLSSIERPNLCVIYELLMRSYTENDQRIWFLSPEQAIASDLDHFVVKAQTIFGFTTYILQT